MSSKRSSTRFAQKRTNKKSSTRVLKREISSVDETRHDRSSGLVPNDHTPLFRLNLCRGGLRRALNPFPSSMRVVFTAETSGQIAAAAAATGNFYWAANSPFLPFNTGVGPPAPLLANNANGTAAYGSLVAATGPYLAYRCAGSATSISFAQSSALDGCSICLAPMNSSFGTFTKAARSRYSNTKTSAAGDGVCSLTNALSTTAFTGDAAIGLTTQSGNAAAYNAYPAALFYWEFWYATGDAAVLTGNIDYCIKVAYDVILENPQFDQELDNVKPELALPLHEAKQALRKAELATALADEDNRAFRLIAASSSSSSSSLSSTSSSSSQSSSAPTATTRTKK